MDEIKLFHQAIKNTERIIIPKYLFQSNYHPIQERFIRLNHFLMLCKLELSTSTIGHQDLSSSKPLIIHQV